MRLPCSQTSIGAPGGPRRHAGKGEGFDAGNGPDLPFPGHHEVLGVDPAFFGIQKDRLGRAQVGSGARRVLQGLADQGSADRPPADHPERVPVRAARRSRAASTRSRASRVTAGGVPSGISTVAVTTKPSISGKTSNFSKTALHQAGGDHQHADGDAEGNVAPGQGPGQERQVKPRDAPRHCRAGHPLHPPPGGASAGPWPPLGGSDPAR